MKKLSTSFGQILGISAFFGLMLASQPAQSSGNFGLGLSLNYNSGGNGFGYIPAPMFGYGAAAGSFGACLGAGGQIGGMLPPGPGFGPGFGGGFGGGMAMPSLPPLPPLIPPHQLYGGGGLGAGMGGFMPGGPGMGGFPHMGPVGCATFCGPAMAYGPAPIMGPVAGGPIYAGGGGMVAGGGGGFSASGSGVYHISGGGTTVIDMRSRNEWEKNDTADIVWGAAMGLGMQTTNVFPFVGPRGAYTNLEFFYNQGPRPYDFQPRPHAAP